MKNIIRILGSVLLLSLLLITAACGNSGSENTGSGESGSEGESGTTETENSDTSFPEEPVTLIVPSAAGGGTDMTARALASATEDHLGVSIGVENRPGGSGSVGMTEGANADPDGYTVTMFFVELTMLKHLGLANITPDDFKPLGLVNLDPAALTVPADAPYDTVEEFVAYAKEHPGELKVGNSGTGSIWHIAAESLEKEAGLEFSHVPYEGAAPAVTALVGGHIDAVTVSPAEVQAQVEAGNLKTLGVMAENRTDIMPDVPTFAEAGVEVTPVATWRGLGVPTETPDEVASVLEEAFAKGAQEEEFVEFMQNSGLGIERMSSEELDEFMESQEQFYGEIISELNLAE